MKGVQRALLSVPGVRNADVNLKTKTADVSYDPLRAKVEQLVDAIKKAAFLGLASASRRFDRSRNVRSFLLGIAGNMILRERRRAAITARVLTEVGSQLQRSDTHTPEATASAAVTAEAQDDGSPPTITWEYRRHHPVDCVTTGAFGATAPATELAPHADEPRWQSTNGFDEVFRDAFGLYKYSGREVAARISDVTLIALRPIASSSRSAGRLADCRVNHAEYVVRSAPVRSAAVATMRSTTYFLAYPRGNSS